MTSHDETWRKAEGWMENSEKEERSEHSICWKAVEAACRAHI